MARRKKRAVSEQLLEDFAHGIEQVAKEEYGDNLHICKVSSRRTELLRRGTLSTIDCVECGRSWTWKQLAALLPAAYRPAPAPRYFEQ